MFSKLSLSGKIGLIILFFHGSIALLAPMFLQVQGHIDLTHALQRPSLTHPFGTDENGIDILKAALVGARPGFMISSITVILGLLIGGFLGASAGYYGGFFDLITMRIVDIIFSFPGLLLNLYVLSLVKNPSYIHVIIALTITSWAGFARLSRGEASVIAKKPFIVSLKVMGASSARIITFHVIPNVAPSLIVQSTFYFGVYLLVEASLSFLGIAPQTDVSWGLLIQQGTRYLLAAPHVAFFPGLLLGISVLGANLAGDGLRDLIS